MKLFQTPLRVLGIFLVLCACAAAQQQIGIQPPSGGWSFVTGPYRAGSVPSIRLQNSSRFASLIRAGNLYLTAHDVVALAIENNIDVEIQRYGPLLAQQVPKASACRASA
jgi:outer membrane protein